jgi:outer membrane protein assembly factor BamB
VNGSSLYLLARGTGEPIWDRPLGMNPTLSVAMSDALVFVPGLNGQVEAYSLPSDEGDQRVTAPWIYHAGGQVTAAPTLASTTVSWATDRGQMFVADMKGPVMLYRRQTGGPIYGRATFLPPDRWVIASTDGYVTALDERSGVVEWEFSTGFDLYQTPIAQADYTYAVTRQNELFCISSDDGLEQWATQGIEQMLACGKDKLYARGTGGTLVALDKQSGKRIASLAASDYSIGYGNFLTDRIYLLTTRGTLLCLREQAAHHPILYRPLPQPPEATATRTETPAEAATDPRTAPLDPLGDDDVFNPDEFGVDDAADAELPAADEPADADAMDEEGDEAEEVIDDPFDFG